MTMSCRSWKNVRTHDIILRMMTLGCTTLQAFQVAWQSLAASKVPLSSILASTIVQSCYLPEIVVNTISSFATQLLESVKKPDLLCPSLSSANRRH